MDKLSEAPRFGKMLAIYTDKVEYRDYNLDELDLETNIDNLLEVHLYDMEKEYRAIKSRREQGFIVCIINDEEEKKGCDDSEIVEYVEEAFLIKNNPDEKKYANKVKIINYIKYNENDMMYISNYRLAMCQEEHYE